MGGFDFRCKNWLYTRDGDVFLQGVLMRFRWSVHSGLVHVMLQDGAPSAQPEPADVQEAYSQALAKFMLGEE